MGKARAVTCIAWCCMYALGPAALGRCATEFSYSSKGNRDPLVPLVGPGAIYQSKGGADIQSIHDVILEGIVYDKDGGSVVIINGIVLKKGDQIGAARVEAIDPRQVVLTIGETQHEVPLREELEEEEGGE